mgnify:CR=1 FL=1
MLPSRYNRENLLRVLRDPRRITTEFEELAHRVDRIAAERVHPREEAITAMDEEWDNLLILDGCRFDLFEDHHDLPGELRKVQSPGSQSLEFMRTNFVDRTHHDTVYVTANPFVTHLDDGIFHRVVNLFDDAWDDDLETVPPGAVVEATRDARERYPNKRLLVHFMQPHYPFIGELGRQLESGALAPVEDLESKTGDSIWRRLSRGDAEVSEETVWDAYVENFDLVHEHVADLTESLDGKSVVTADHGNLVGERLWPIPVRRYGHPSGLRVPELIDVPWHELPVDERRTVEPDPPESTADVSSETVEDRLGHLGYV